MYTTSTRLNSKTVEDFNPEANELPPTHKFVLHKHVVVVPIEVVAVLQPKLLPIVISRQDLATENPPNIIKLKNIL